LATCGPKSSTVTETGCGGDTVDQVGWRPIVVNKMHKQAELVSDAMLYTVNVKHSIRYSLDTHDLISYSYVVVMLP